MLDRLDSEERFALLKMATGGLRIGVSARLAKTALAQAFGLDLDAVEEVWHGLAPPYAALFAWAAFAAPASAQLPQPLPASCPTTPDASRLPDAAGLKEMNRIIAKGSRPTGSKNHVRYINWIRRELSGSTRPPALRCAAVEPAAGPIQRPLDFCSSWTAAPSTLSSERM